MFFNTILPLDIPALETIPETLARRQILIVNESGDPVPSVDDWMRKLINQFQLNSSIISIEFSAKISLEGTWHYGLVEIGRNGKLAVSLKHCFRVEWDDLEGNRHEQDFFRWEDAQNEAARLDLLFDYVAIKYVPAN